MNVPAPPTVLIGRELDVAAVLGYMRRPDIRLLTLTGVGGSGKTRLAIEVAGQLQDEFADGVCFIPLSSVVDATLVVSNIAQALGIYETDDRSLQARLITYLRDRQLLLFIDNFEQVIAAAPSIAELLAACPGLKMIVTSRAPLRVRYEQEFAVLPLALPERGRQDPIALVDVAAVALFIDRARSARPTLQLSASTLEAIAEICIRLDGLPLAIELAAARVKLLPPEIMRSRLDHRLQVLTGGARDLPPRQQTLRNAIGWSYDLLAPDEQRLFRHLALFVGGCTIQAVEQTTTGCLEVDLLNALQTLLDSNLLQHSEQADREPRFTMLETIREYALECLRENGEEGAAGAAHARYYLDFAERAEPHLTDRMQRSWLKQLDIEHDNLRAALRWFLDHGQAEWALRLSGSVWRFWLGRGFLNEGRAWLEAALEPVPRGMAPSPDPFAARALNAAGVLAHYHGDYGRAARYCGQSLEMYRLLGDKRGVAVALGGLALVARTGGDYAGAYTLYDESLAILRELDLEWDIASTLLYMGLVPWLQNDLARARPLLEEAATRLEAAGDERLRSYALGVLGGVVRGQSDSSQARSLLEESLRISRRLGDRRGEFRALHALADLAALTGQFEEARHAYEATLAILIEIGDRQSIALCLEGLGGVAAAANKCTASTGRRYAAALRELIGAPLPPYYRVHYEYNLSVAAAQLNEQAYATAWAAGLAMPLDQVISAREWVSPTTGPDTNSAEPRERQTARSRASNTFGLSQRELEVLRLVAEGLTDSEIARRLTLSPRTINAHLRSIYSKLQVSSRSAATRQALDARLV